VHFVDRHGRLQRIPAFADSPSRSDRAIDRRCLVRRMRFFGLSSEAMAYGSAFRRMASCPRGRISYLYSVPSVRPEIKSSTGRSRHGSSWGAAVRPID
jgi:hypothetical protein